MIFFVCVAYAMKFFGSPENLVQAPPLAPTLDGTAEIPNLSKSPNAYREPHSQNTAGAWGYIIQIIFQTCAGAAMLTDIVFWLVLYPFMAPKDFRLDFFTVGMHSVNALILLGETSLNCMRFPVFRFAYFILWTATFVIFQWIIHAVVSMWYLAVGSAHSMLWRLCFDSEVEAIVVVKNVSWFLSVCKVIIHSTTLIIGGGILSS